VVVNVATESSEKLRRDLALAGWLLLDVWNRSHLERGMATASELHKFDFDIALSRHVQEAVCREMRSK